MKVRLLLGLSLLITLIALSGCGSSGGGATVTFNCTVIKSDHTTAFNGVLVEVLGTGLSATTDASGNVSITGIPAGSHMLRFSYAADATVAKIYRLVSDFSTSGKMSMLSWTQWSTVMGISPALDGSTNLFYGSVQSGNRGIAGVTASVNPTVGNLSYLLNSNGKIGATETEFGDFIITSIPSSPNPYTITCTKSGATIPLVSLTMNDPAIYFVPIKPSALPLSCIMKNFSNNPLSGVSVEVVGTGKSTVSLPVTGQATINQVPVGNYFVKFTYPGTVPIYFWTQGNTISLISMVMVTWAQWADSLGPTFDEATSVVSGMIVDEKFDGIPGVVVSTLPSVGTGNILYVLDSSLNKAVAGTQTESAGKFLIEKIALNKAYSISLTGASYPNFNFTSSGVPSLYFISFSK